MDEKARAEPDEAVMDEDEMPDPLLRALFLGETITKEKAMQIPAVAGAIDRIANVAANIPIKLYRHDDDDSKVLEVKNDIRTFMLNDDPNDTLDACQMKQALVRDYFLSGRGYIYVEWGGLEPVSLRYVDSTNISTVKNSDVIFKKFVVLVQGKSYFPEEFIRILRDSDDGVNGKGIIHEHDKVLSVAYHSLKFEENLVRTGGNKKGFLKSARNLSQEAMNNLKRAWRSLYSNNEENVMILNNGIDFQEASNTSVEMQLNENKQTNDKEIRNLFGVPDDIGSEEGDKAFVKYCINGFMSAFMTALNRALLLESEKGKLFFAPDMYELTKGDTDKRYAAYKTAADTGWLQIDEIRAKENMPPLGINMVKLGLQDVLYDPATKQVYIPNMNQYAKLGGGEGKGEESNLEQNPEKNPSSSTDM